MQIGISLIALALGYFVFVEASKEKKDRHRTFGRAIAIYIILMALASSLIWAAKYANYCSMRYGMRNPAFCPVK